MDYIHVTEFEAWRPAFAEVGPTLVQLARTHAPDVAVIANGSLHDPVRAAAAFADGADLVALGRGALSNPDWPRRLKEGQALAAFDPALLSPFGDIKATELADVIAGTCSLAHRAASTMSGESVDR